MNNIIKDQLNKCKVAEIPLFDEHTTKLHIECKKEIYANELTKNRYYLIKLANYILNPPPNFNLHINMNNNIIPKCSCMKCEVLDRMGKLIKVYGVGFDLENNIDLNDVWEGWLPEASITVIKEL